LAAKKVGGPRTGTLRDKFLTESQIRRLGGGTHQWKLPLDMGSVLVKKIAKVPPDYSSHNLIGQQTTKYYLTQK